MSLTKLHLQCKKLVRDLPANFFKCLQLADVNLSDNFLSGAVSDAVGDLRALRLLKPAGKRHSDADKGVIQDCLSAYLPDLVRQGGFKI